MIHITDFSFTHNPNKIQFKIYRRNIPLTGVAVDFRNSLMIVVNNQNLEPSAKLKPSADYIRRATIIEDVRTGRLAT